MKKIQIKLIRIILKLITIGSKTLDGNNISRSDSLQSVFSLNVISWAAAAAGLFVLPVDMYFGIC